jgi:hypothetical protein
LDGILFPNTLRNEALLDLALMNHYQASVFPDLTGVGLYCYLVETVSTSHFGTT